MEAERGKEEATSRRKEVSVSRRDEGERLRRGEKGDVGESEATLTQEGLECQ